MTITVLGARGSIPVEGKDVLAYGGATSSILVETETEAVLIDAGTGILHASELADKHISIFLTHPHLDHILGLPFFPYLSQPNKRIDFYAKRYLDMRAGDILNRLFAPPFWPCRIGDYPADFVSHDLALPMRIGEIDIEGIESAHPGGSIIYKLTCEGKSVVYATDYEYEEDRDKKLIRFAQGADLLLFDAQYTEEELKTKSGYGHSTMEQGLLVMEQSGVKQMRFVHHNPSHDDQLIQEREQAVKRPNVAFAKRGEVIEL